MPAQNEFRVFVFTKTVAYRHTSIPAGIEALRRLGTSKTNPFTIEASEDASLINATYLSPFKAVVFLSTSGEFLTADQLAGLKRYVNAGGGFVGIHCASSGMRSEPWYGELVGAYFTRHPVPQRGVVRIEHGNNDKGGQGVVETGFEDLGGEFAWFDEWYNFSWNPREKYGATVLLTADAESFEGGEMGADHPLAWCREFEGGRSFYTALGHFDEAFGDERFMRHVLNGILWVARLA